MTAQGGSRQSAVGSRGQPPAGMWRLAESAIRMIRNPSRLPTADCRLPTADADG